LPGSVSRYSKKLRPVHEKAHESLCSVALQNRPRSPLHEALRKRSPCTPRLSPTILDSLRQLRFSTAQTDVDAPGYAETDRGPPQRQEEGGSRRRGLAKVLRGCEGVSGERMSRWEQAPEIIDLAGELGVGRAAPVEGILDHCRRRIDGWVSEAGGGRLGGLRSSPSMNSSRRSRFC